MDNITRKVIKAKMLLEQQQHQEQRKLKPHHLAHRLKAYQKIIIVLLISPLHKTDIHKYAHVHKSTITKTLYDMSHKEIIYRYRWSLPFHDVKTRRGAYGETYYLLNLKHPLVKQFLEYNKQFNAATKPIPGAKEKYQELKELGSSNPFADLAVHLKIQGIKYRYADLWNEFDKAELIL